MKILWALLSIAVTFIFFIAIPIHIYHRIPIIFAIIYLVIIFFCLLNFFVRDRPLMDAFKYYEDISKDLSRKIAPITVFPSIILMIVLMIYRGREVNSILKEYGVYTIGKVTKGDSKTSIKKSTYNITVEFTDDSNKKNLMETSVTQDNYYMIGINSNVLVLYWPLHPSISTVVFDDDKLFRP